jgi:membrane protease YdiL (CAAX protease family)
VAWLVIFACVAYIIGTNAMEKAAAGPGNRADAHVGFRIAARYAVGVHHTFSSLQPAGAPSQAAQLLPQVDGEATDTDEKVRAAIVAGEVSGAAAATQRLDQLPPDARDREDVRALRAVYESGNAVGIGATQRDAVIGKHGWFGRLALSFGSPPDDPERRAALRPAVRTAVMLFVATGVGGLALLTGFVLLVVAFVRWLGGGFVTAYRPATAPTGPFLEAFAVYLLGMVGIAAVVRRIVGDRVGATWFVVVILPLVFLWPLLRGIPRADLRAGLGWHRGRGLWREAAAGFVGYLAGLPVLLAGGMITLLLQRFSGSDTSHPIVNEVARGGWRTVQLFFLAALWAPVVEETMFRGAFFHHLRARLRWPLAAGAVALLFAAVHPQGWAAIPVLGAIAMTLAAIREWRGSIVASVVAHAVNNGAVTLLLVSLLS